MIMLSKKIIIATMAVPFLIACSKQLVKEEPGSENVTIANSIEKATALLKHRLKLG